MAEEKDIPTYQNITTGILKEKIYQQLETTTDPGQRKKTRKMMEKLMSDWQTRGLIPPDAAPGPSRADRNRVQDYEKGELAMRRAEWEKSGKKKYGLTKTALDKAERRMARVTCLLLNMRHAVPGARCLESPVTKIKEEKPELANKLPLADPPTQALQPTVNQLYPDLPPRTYRTCITPTAPCAPPAYAPSTNPFYPTPEQASISIPVQAPMVEVKGGILYLNQAERDDQLKDLLENVRSLSRTAEQMMNESERMLNESQRVMENKKTVEKDTSRTLSPKDHSTPHRRSLLQIKCKK